MADISPDKSGKERGEGDDQQYHVDGVAAGMRRCFGRVGQEE